MIHHVLVDMRITYDSLDVPVDASSKSVRGPKRTVPTFNSCTKCTEITVRPISIRLPGHGWHHNWMMLWFVNNVSHWCGWLIVLACYAWLFVQPGTGTRPVDASRNKRVYCVFGVVKDFFSEQVGATDSNIMFWSIFMKMSYVFQETSHWLYMCQGRSRQLSPHLLCRHPLI